MAQIRININDNHIQRVLNAFAIRFGYDDRDEEGNLLNRPENETKAQFAKKMISQQIKKITLQIERAQKHSEAIAAINSTLPVDDVDVT